MIQTMSGPNDWLQFYDQNIPTTQSLTPSTPNFINVTAVTTTTIATPPLGMSNASSSGSAHLSPEGRVSKPARRRSRASRRTPTTLLNTDTTNFRAMVQQFTGGPTVPFAPTPTTAPQIFQNLMGFGFPSRPGPSPSPTTLMISSPPVGYHSHQQQQQQQQQQMFQPQNQQYNMYSSGGGAQGGEHTFFQRLSNNPIRPPTSNVDGDGVLNMDHGRFFPSASSS